MGIGSFYNWITTRISYSYLVIRILSTIIITLPSFYYHSWLNSYYQVIPKPITQEENNKKKVIIYVHGMKADETQFYPLIEKMKKTISNEYMLRPVYIGDTSRTDISEDAIRLGYEIEKYNNCDITLIGISKGGLAVIYYAINNKDKRIKKIITIATPVMGTEGLKIFPEEFFLQSQFSTTSINILQMVSQVDLLTIPIYHVVGMWDTMIYPKNAAIYPKTPKENIYYCYWPYNHIGINYNEYLAELLVQWIN